MACDFCILDVYPRNFLSIYLAWLVFSSFLSVSFYGYDKIKAISGSYRISENVLHLLAISGGFLGCALGMVLFRHKIRKNEFKALIFLAFSIHSFIFLYLLMFWL